MKKLGTIALFHRKKSGLSRVALAKLAGVGKTAVFDIEKGKPTVQLDTVLKVLKVLNIEILFQSPLMQLYEESVIPQQHQKAGIERLLKLIGNNERARVYVDTVLAGHLLEVERGRLYKFLYLDNYTGPSVSLEMPTTQQTYEYDRFPPFFEGLLPEGLMLEGLLKQTKIDRNDLMAQIIAVGEAVVGNVSIRAGEQIAIP